MNIDKAVFHGWPGYRMRAGEISLGLTPGIGGRIISLEHEGEELLFVQEEHKGETFDFRGVEDLNAEKRRLGFRVWGGDKTWIAPQSEWSERVPPLELDAGMYEGRVEGGAVVMESAPCRETGLRIVRRVSLEEDGEIILDQRIVNTGDKPVHRGIWNVTQLLRPFDVYLPVKAAAVRAYPGEGRSEELRERVISQETGWTKIACCEAIHFKYGCVADHGRVTAVREAGDQRIVFTRSFETERGARYAHGSCVEVYNSPDYAYLEIEVHAPLVTLAPGESASHRQQWRVTRFPKGRPLSEIP